MKPLQQLIDEYTALLQQQEIQLAYRGILDYLGRLRADFVRRYPQFDVGGLYQGYMDMSYFSITTKALKDKGLKFALVYQHGTGRFEVWLSARNREIAKELASVWKGWDMGLIQVSHSADEPDAILESVLTPKPDFEHPEALTDNLCRGTERFIEAVGKHLPA